MKQSVGSGLPNVRNLIDFVSYSVLLRRTHRLETLHVRCSKGLYVTHELIYDGDKPVGVRLFDKAEGVGPILRKMVNNPASQMEIQSMDMSIGADTPGVWNGNL